MFNVIKAMLGSYMVVRDYISRHNMIFGDDEILKKNICFTFYFFLGKRTSKRKYRFSVCYIINKSLFMTKGLAIKL